MMRLICSSSAVVGINARQYRPKTSATVGGACSGVGRVVAINGQSQSSIERRWIGIVSINAVAARIICTDHGSESHEVGETL